MSALRTGPFAASIGLLSAVVRAVVGAVAPAVVLAVLLAHPAIAATPLEAVHGLEFFVHADLVQDAEGRGLDFWKQRLRRALDQATLALQGVQGQGSDNPCCTRIEPADPVTELEIFGEVGDPWSVVASAADYDALKAAFPTSGVYIILSLEACGATTSTTVVGCADQGPDGGDHIVVDVVDDDDAMPEPSYSHNLEGLGVTIAHERGHNVGLVHTNSERCQLMDGVVGGGCMISFPDCMQFEGKATRTGEPCLCMNSSTIFLPPDGLITTTSQLADGSQCSEPEGGVCSGGVCGNPVGDAGVSVFAVGDQEPGLLGEPLNQSPAHMTLSGLTGGWRLSGSPGAELTGLAYARGRGVTYAVGPGSGSVYRLVELDPQLNNIASEVDLDCSGTSLSCAPITALAWDEDADRLLGVETEVAFVQDGFFYDESTLVSIDPDTGVVSELGLLGGYAIPGGITGLAYDDVAGRLYGATQADILDIWDCSPETPCSWVFVAKTRRFESALTVDPATGRLYLTGRDGSGLTYRVFDPASPPHFENGLLEPEFKVRIKTVGIGGLAALGSTPIPEPAAGGMALGALASLALLARRRRRG